MPTGPANLTSPSQPPAPQESCLSGGTGSGLTQPWTALRTQQMLGSLSCKLCSGPATCRETRAGSSQALGLLCHVGMTKWNILGASTQAGPDLCGDRTCWRSHA